MRKIKDFKLFDSEPVVMGNRVKPVNPFIPFEKEDIHQSVAGRFEQQVEKYPDNIAVKTVNKVLTYRRLNIISNQIAHTIFHRYKYEGECGAALLFEHDADMIPGIMGALKAGKFYIPLNPTYPIERLAYILEDSRTNLLITNGNNRSLALELLEITGGRIVLIDIDMLESGVPEENPSLDIEPGNLAYILYTSGSTGKPKGVIQDQRNVLHFARVYTNALHINSHDRLTQFSSYGFDAAKMDIFGALLNGAALYPFVVKQEGSLDRLARWLKSEKITIYHSIPTVYRYFVDSLNSEDTFPDLRFIVLGGEAVFKRDVENYKKFFFPGCLFINGLGPTESTVTVQYFVDKEMEIVREAVPVGYAVDETHVFLLNENNRETRQYEPGEIIFKSDYLALGYLNNVEKTHELFGPDPLTGEGRVYRTGDMGRILPDASIEYVGRNDSQVKVNGFRIELGEIEGNLDNIDGMKKSVVLCKQDRSGENYLAAYYVKNEGTDLDANILIKNLKEIIPDFLIPRVFIQLKEFPLTLTGKIDRNALPDSEEGEDRAFIPPANQLEEKVLEIWAEVLGLETQEISMDSNFFEIGGQSFKAVILAAKIQKEFDVGIPLQDLFELSTASEMAAYLAKDTAEDTFVPIEPVEKKEYYPLSSAQRRLYVIWQMDPHAVTYNILQVIPLQGAPDREKLAESFKKVIQRHESLRTSFHIVADEPVQRILEKVEFEIEYFYLTARKEKEQENWQRPDPGSQELLADNCIKIFMRPFDLTRASLMRVGLIRLPHTPTNQPRPGPHTSQEGKEDNYLLMVDIHHIIADGVSLVVLKKDFTALYENRALTPMRLHYKDFARWQNSEEQKEKLKQQEDYWLKELAGELPKLKLPIDYERTEVQNVDGKILTFELTPGQINGLKELAENEQATIFMVIAAIYNILLFKICGQEDIIIGSDLVGRRHTDLEKIIGMFVNTIVLRSHIQKEKTFSDFLKEVKESTLNAYENQDYHFDNLVEKVEIKREPGRNPLFDTMITYRPIDLSMFSGSTASGGEASTRRSPVQDLYRYDKTTAMFDLVFHVITMEDNISFFFEYRTKLFKEKTIKTLIGFFREIVTHVLDNREKEINQVKISHHLVSAAADVPRITFGF
jgi:amino acid adenylation domain-containing protein